MKKLLLIAALLFTANAHAASYWLTSDKGHMIGPYSSLSQCYDAKRRLPGSIKWGAWWSCEMGY